MTAKLSEAQIIWLRRASTNWCGKGSVMNPTAQALAKRGYARAASFSVGGFYWTITDKGRDLVKSLEPDSTR